MLTLGIETSCDETSVALLRDGREIVANLIASQVDAHQIFGGVVPEIASRRHLEALNPLLGQLKHETGLAWGDLSHIAVTRGPGLVGALLVGVAAGKALGYAHRVPVLGVNHVEGHILSNFLAQPDLEFPLLAFVVSGGHSDLILMRGHGQFERLGRTRDDAVGEAFDKAARALHLPMPGGPNLEKLAREGDSRAFDFKMSNLEPSLDVSYSGLKTAVAQAAQKYPDRTADIAASFQRVAIQQLRAAIGRALQVTRPATFGLCGGVAANNALRTALREVVESAGVTFVVPEPVLCTDNAAMIACAGYYRFMQSPPEARAFALDVLDFEARSVLRVGEA